MARTPRIMLAGEPTIYHVMSRTALERYPLDSADKDFFVSQVVKLSKLYFAEIFGFYCMGNHFHLLVRMWPGENYSDAELKKRLSDYYGEAREFTNSPFASLRQKLESLSEHVREIKLRFTRYSSMTYPLVLSFLPQCTGLLHIFQHSKGKYDPDKQQLLPRTGPVD